MTEAEKQSLTPRENLARTFRRVSNDTAASGTERMRAALALVSLGDGAPDVPTLARIIEGKTELD